MVTSSSGLSVKPVLVPLTGSSRSGRVVIGVSTATGGSPTGSLSLTGSLCQGL